MKLKKQIILTIGILSAGIISGCTSYQNYSYAVEGNPPIATPTDFSAESDDVSYSDKIVEKDILFYNSLWFNTKSSNLDLNDTQNQLVIKYNLNYLNDNEEALITINGYASELGTKSLNLNLSKKRALFVQNYFVSNGIDKSRIKIIANGNTGNVYPEAKNENNPSNRRIDIVYTKLAPSNYNYSQKQPKITVTTNKKELSN